MSPFRHHWCHQYSSHKLAIISQWNVVLSHYLFSTITVIYVLQSSIWLILMIHKFWVMHWVIAVFYLYIDHCHEHVSWTVAIHNILHQNCFFYFQWRMRIEWFISMTHNCDSERRIMSGINLDNLSADQMLAGAAALQGDAKDYSNTQDVEGLN